jgi:hypothetical protein
VSQHAELSEEKWGSFSREQQLLMIANEMNRASKWTGADDLSRLKSCYERVLRLTDLTVGVQTKSTFRLELLRWRDLIAELFICEVPRPEDHREAFRALLGFSPATYEQARYLVTE